jgi:iron complex outermembrane receptor protein
MFRRTQVCSALMLAFGGGIMASAIPAFAQDAAQPVQQLQRVEITGSAIKRIDAETSVPVTILKVEDLKKQGVTTVEQLMNQLGSNQQSQGVTASVGLTTGGASFANLRGLGQNKTLVLLNGRRIANNAIDSSAPDLGMIPFAALDRVEVLRDGASALYGTDAIGGVINFITKRNYTGGSITLGYDEPEHIGGKQTNVNIGYGFGDLTKDRFNVFGFFDYKKQSEMTAAQRPDILARSLKTSPTSNPGQYNQGGAVQNPTFPTCNTPNGIPLGDGVTDATCGYLYARAVDLIPKNETFTAYTKATFQLGDNHQGSLEYFFSKNAVATTISAVPYGALWMNPTSKYYPGNGITPAPTVFALDPAYLPGNAPAGALPGVIALRWRTADLGGRAQVDDNRQSRLVASLDGTLGAWDYKAGISFNSNWDHAFLTGGYTNGDIITAGVLNGALNPFGPQDAAGTALLSSALDTGNLYNTRGDVKSVDVQASREIGDWFKAGRAAAIAVGGEFRRENFYFQAVNPLAAEVVASTGFSPDTNSVGSRNVAAIYTELNVPILKELDITGSLRYDKYSDFGNTTNPKVSFRYQPVQPLLVRGSYSTGFRAPSLYDLYAPRTFTNTADNLNDPVRCPGGNPIAGASRSDNCGVQFESLAGGNPNLKPEKSKNWTLGFVVEPSSNLNFGVDFWWITLTQQIGSPLDTDIFNGAAGQFAGSFHRAPDGSLATDGSLCPGPNCGYIDQFQTNLGGVKTAGVDLSANYRMRLESVGNFNFGFNGTYVYKYQYQTQDGGDYFNNLGVYGGGVALSSAQGGPVFRWQHTLTANWTRGDYGVGIVNHFKTGYADQDPSNQVASYTTWDTYGTWQATKGLGLTAGIRNLANRAPPFSNQAATFQTGYDPRFADAAGRTFYMRGTYNF